ncbi:MAG: hypothetical protein IIB38_00845 [Candidatus Hydrogenedentes bacterium]|nr:hypothetical protein [Candidatus Hydrogenedentota bacterium]
MMISAATAGQNREAALGNGNGNGNGNGLGISGCTNEDALNYHERATEDDCSCLRPMELRNNRSNHGGELTFVDGSLRGIYPADIVEWRSIVSEEEDFPDDDDLSSKIVTSVEECALQFEEYNFLRNEADPRALAFTVSKRGSEPGLVCRLQDRLVVDLGPEGEIKHAPNETVGRWLCAEYREEPEAGSGMSCPTGEILGAEGGMQVPLCNWDDEKSQCVEFSSAYYKLGPEEEKNEIRQGAALSSACLRSLDFEGRCPETEVLGRSVPTLAWGLEIDKGAVGDGEWLDRIRLMCAPLKPNGTLDLERNVSSNYLGDADRESSRNSKKECPPALALIGTSYVQYARAQGPSSPEGQYLTGLGFGICKSLKDIAQGVPNNENNVSLPTLGGYGNMSERALCPPGSVANGLTDGSLDGIYPCQFYWNCTKLEMPEVTSWEIDYPYFDPYYEDP